MVEWYGNYKVKDEGDVWQLAAAWVFNLEDLRQWHPRVFKKVEKEILEYTGEQKLIVGLKKLAEELLGRHKKNKNLQGIKIALTYSKYQRFHYGSLVKLYVDGSVAYNPRATIEGYGFVIHDGELVA